ncbi:MAG: chorismate synthase [Bacteroidetes bacterium]|nr:chorismate synthase [Bacteroidota bacterium]
MAANTLGEYFAVTSFGESHGPGVGVVIDGVPAGIPIDTRALQIQLNRRRPGQSAVTTPRQEKDSMQVLSGLYEGKTLGSPVTLYIPNEDARPADYDHLENVFRPGHADFTYDKKYGFRDPRGGGRSSARVTAGWVAAGALAEQILQSVLPVQIIAWVSSVLDVSLSPEIQPENREQVDGNIVRCPDALVARQMIETIEALKQAGDSAGGLITCRIAGVPAGLGAPVFSKLHARLGHALLSLNAVKGISFGDGFAAVHKRGSEFNDTLINDQGGIHTLSNHAGGIQGGISNGEDILFQVAFRPTSTIQTLQATVTTAGENTTLEAAGRHDPCVVPRAVPIVESLAACVLLDLYMEQRAHRL